MPGKIQEAIEKIRQRGFTVHCFLFFCYCGVQPRSYIKPYVLNRLNMFVNSSTRNHAKSYGTYGKRISFGTETYEIESKVGTWACHTAS